MLSQQLLHEQVREKTDKFQQRRLDGFFKAGAKAIDEGNAAEEAEPPAMPEVMAMEVEMEVSTPSVCFTAEQVSLPILTHCPFQFRPSSYFTGHPKSLSMQTQCLLSADPMFLSMQRQRPFQCKLSVSPVQTQCAFQGKLNVCSGQTQCSFHLNASVLSLLIVPFSTFPSSFLFWQHKPSSART